MKTIAFFKRLFVNRIVKVTIIAILIFLVAGMLLAMVGIDGISRIENFWNGIDTGVVAVKYCLVVVAAFYWKETCVLIAKLTNKPEMAPLIQEKWAVFLVMFIAIEFTSLIA